VWVKVCCFDVGGSLGRVARLADAHGIRTTRRKIAIL
jgi:hypothetical protein